MLKRIGKYEITGELGRGGFSRVYRGFDPNVNRPVAIKVATTESDREHLSRFRNEASAAGNLRHRNIVTIHDYGDEEGVPYLVMELLEGRDLHQASNSGEKLTLIEVVQIMSQVAEGLHCAHLHGVVHRDIKPANIMLLPDGTVKILDFGIARLTGNVSRLTQNGHMIGTPLYMSPEQLGGAHADALCDIWAYGVNYFEILVGQHPFLATDNVRLTRNITMIDPPPVHALASGIPDSLAQVIQRALTKDRRRRYQSMEEILVDTNPILRQLQREHTKSIFNEGLKFKDDGQIAASQKAFKRVLEVDPNNDDAQHELKSLQKQSQEAKLAAHASEPERRPAPLTQSFQIAGVPVAKAPSDPRSVASALAVKSRRSAAVATPPSTPPPAAEPAGDSGQTPPLNGHAAPFTLPFFEIPHSKPAPAVIIPPVAILLPPVAKISAPAVPIAPVIVDPVPAALAPIVPVAPIIPAPVAKVSASAPALDVPPPPPVLPIAETPVEPSYPLNGVKLERKPQFQDPLPVEPYEEDHDEDPVEQIFSPPTPLPAPITALFEPPPAARNPPPRTPPPPPPFIARAPVPRPPIERLPPKSRSGSVLNLGESATPIEAHAPLPPPRIEPSVIKRRPVAYPARREDEPGSVRRSASGGKARKSGSAHVASLTVVKKVKKEKVRSSSFPWTTVGFAAAALVAAAGMLMMLWSGNGAPPLSPPLFRPLRFHFTGNPDSATLNACPYSLPAVPPIPITPPKLTRRGSS